MAYIVKRTWTATLPDGTKQKRRSDCYSIRYIDNGRRRWVKGYTDLGATKQKAAKLEAALARGEQGLVDTFKPHKARTLIAHVEDYLRDLKSLGRDPMYVYNVERRLHVLIDACGWESIADISANDFRRWREKRQKVGSKQGHTAAISNGASPRTMNQWLETVRGFCNWLVENGRLQANPLARVAKVEGDAVRKRRALSDDQLAAIVAAAPPSRRLPWELLLSTGLRVQEAIDLEWQDCRLESTKPYVALRASKVKSRREQMLPLRQDLAGQLREHRPAEHKPTDRVFTKFPKLKHWKADLAAAGVAYFDGANRQADRHALRTTLGTRLQKAGIPIRVAMELMRHSDVRLTTKVYTDPTAFDLSGAVESLPAVKRPDDQRSEPSTPAAG